MLWVFVLALTLTFPSLDLCVLEEGSVGLNDVIFEIFQIAEDDAILDLIAPILELFLGHGLLVFLKWRAFLFCEGHYRLLGLLDIAHFLFVVENEDLRLFGGRLLCIWIGVSGRDVLLVAEVGHYRF